MLLAAAFSPSFSALPRHHSPGGWSPSRRHMLSLPRRRKRPTEAAPAGQGARTRRAGTEERARKLGVPPQAQARWQRRRVRRVHWWPAPPRPGRMPAAKWAAPAFSEMPRCPRRGCQRPWRPRRAVAAVSACVCVFVCVQCQRKPYPRALRVTPCAPSRHAAGTTHGMRSMPDKAPRGWRGGMDGLAG
jgi:hypothetical protein